MDKVKVFDKLTNLLGAPIENISQSFYDSFVEQNVKFRAKAGLKETIIRKQIGKCCDWCARLAGIYDASDAPDDIYRRHENCRCMVTHKSEKGGYTDVWSKKEYETQKKARIVREKEIAESQNSNIIANKREQKENSVLISTNYDRKRVLTKNSKSEIKMVLNNEIKVRKIDEKEFEIYVSEAATFKEYDLKNLKKGIKKSLKELGIKEINDFPTIVIAKERDIEGAAGLYNPVSNQLTFSDKIGNKGYMVDLQKENKLTDPNNPFSSIKHELIHWEDACNYEKEFGKITKENIAEYNAYRNRVSLEALDKLGIYEYNVHKYGWYARKCYAENEYDEVYVEYRVMTR